VGGIDLADRDCRTGVPGLFAAGDAATRELVAGANSGGGAVNAAWALSSGRIAGAAAATEALQHTGQGTAQGLGRYGLHPSGAVQNFDLGAINAQVDEHIHGYQRAFWRQESSLADSARQLDALWHPIAAHAHARGEKLVALRESIAMLATARWATASALARRESRGLHQREDYPQTNVERPQRLLVSGFDTVIIAQPHWEPA